jgi:hypothetical protein
MGSRLYNCKDSKTLHEIGANLRLFSEKRKDKGEKHDSWALQGKILQIVINQMVNSCQGVKEVIFATLKSVLFAIKVLSLQQKS